MRDPHVVALRYKVETTPTVTFDNPPAIEDEADAFRFRLENGRITFELKEHFSSIEAARNIVDSFLRSWELETVLRFGRQEFKFVFEDADVIDRDPPPPAPPGSPRVIQLSGIASATAFGTVTLSIARREYPSPPKHFRVNPDVDTLWYRFDGYSQGREPLLSMAHFCLTLLEARAGGRKNVEKLYKVHKKILDKLGELTTIKGDEKTARKLKKISTLKPLTRAETNWVEAAIKTIIRRVGEVNSDPSLQMIIMSDLPPL